MNRHSPMTQKLIMNQYRSLFRICRNEYDKPGLEIIRKAYNLMVEHSSDDHLVYGESSIIHSTQLARMVVKELEMDPITVATALVLRCVLRKKVPVEDVKETLGPRIASILIDLLKISTVAT